jgi:hypothetical protein
MLCCLPYAHPLGYTLSWAFFRSPKTQMALSARQREHGLLPSHLEPGQFLGRFLVAMSLSLLHTLDFFKRQRSQALHTRLRTLSECE